MKITAATGLLALAATSVTAITIDCSKIRIDKVPFDVSLLAGPKAVSLIDNDSSETRYTNTTFDFDLCKPLKENEKSSTDRCDQGAYVCASERHYNKQDQEGVPPIDSIWSIAGEFSVGGSGHALDPSYERIGNETTETDGIRIFFYGGQKKNGGGKDFMPQMAVFDLICDPSVTGFEPAGSEGDESKKPLQLDSYKIAIPSGKDKDYGVLTINWRTKYACEGEADKDHSGDLPDSNAKKASWGFFTWIIIILFLGVAAYLIFGSWLNYSRNGARGWDLLPHSDTIRDIPYIVKDLGRRVVTTVQGGGRGGYNQSLSAVTEEFLAAISRLKDGMAA